MKVWKMCLVAFPNLNNKFKEIPIVSTAVCRVSKYVGVVSAWLVV